MYKNTFSNIKRKINNSSVVEIYTYMYVEIFSTKIN